MAVAQNLKLTIVSIGNESNAKLIRLNSVRKIQPKIFFIVHIIMIIFTQNLVKFHFPASTYNTYRIVTNNNNIVSWFLMMTIRKTLVYLTLPFIFQDDSRMSESKRVNNNMLAIVRTEQTMTTSK